MASRKPKKFRVLVVDNDKTIQTRQWTRCITLGFSSHVADDGKEAVDLFRAGETFDLVLMEMNMPVMDGPTATKELRDMGVKSMIVGVSTQYEDPQVKEYMAAGLNDFYLKPVTVETLLALEEDVVIGKDP